MNIVFLLFLWIWFVWLYFLVLFFFYLVLFWLFWLIFLSFYFIWLVNIFLHWYLIFLSRTYCSQHLSLCTFRKNWPHSTILSSSKVVNTPKPGCVLNSKVTVLGGIYWQIMFLCHFSLECSGLRLSGLFKFLAFIVPLREVMQCSTQRFHLQS